MIHIPRKITNKNSINEIIKKKKENNRWNAERLKWNERNVYIILMGRLKDSGR